MPLEYGIAEIPLFNGIETGADDKLGADLRLKEVVNADFGQDGALRKRNGYSENTDTLIEIGGPSSSDAIFDTIKPGYRMELYSGSDDGVILGARIASTSITTGTRRGDDSYLMKQPVSENTLGSPTNGWVLSHPYLPGSLTIDDYGHSNRAVNVSANSLKVNGHILSVLIFSSQDFALDIRAFDAETGRSIGESILVEDAAETSAAFTRMVAITNKIFVIYMKQNIAGINFALKYHAFDTITRRMSSGTFPITINAAGNSQYIFDACESPNGNAVIVTRNSAGTGIDIYELERDATVTLQIARLVDNPVTPITCFATDGFPDTIVVAYGITFPASETKAFSFTASTFVIDVAETTVLSGIVGASYNITGQFDPLDSVGTDKRASIVIERAETSGATGSDIRRVIYVASFPLTAGAAIPTTMVLRGISLESKAFVLLGKMRFIGRHDAQPENDQSGYFMFDKASKLVDLALDDENFNVSASFLNNLSFVGRPVGSATVIGYGLPDVQVADKGDTGQSNFVSIPFTRDLSSAKGSTAVRVEIDTTNRTDDVPLVTDGDLFSSCLTRPLGGNFWDNIGSYAPIIGHKPLSIDFLSTQTTGGSLSDGTYQYLVLMEAVSPNGKVIRSRPSLATTVVLTGGTSTQEITFNIKSMNVLDQNGNNVTYSVFRTAVNQGIFRRVNLLSFVTFGFTFFIPANQKDPMRIGPFTDGVSDATMATNEILYTTGGVLASDPFPPIRSIAKTKDRYFFIPQDRDDIIAYTKLFEIGIFPEWNFANIIRWKDTPVLKLGVLTDKVYVFSSRSISYLIGKGPDNTGNGSFQEPVNISSEIGIESVNSLVETPVGIVFRSNGGFFIIDKSTALTYIGSPIRVFDSVPISNAFVVKGKNEARFILSDGTVLTFNYTKSKWTTHLVLESEGNFVQSSSAISGGSGLAIIGNKLLAEDTGFADDGIAVPMKVKTRWIQFAGPQGLQRIRRIGLIGNFKSNHTINIRVFYDGDDTTVAQTITFDTSVAIPTGVDYQFRARLDRQKCRSIMFEVEDSSQSGTNESAELNFLTIEYAVIGGINRLPAARTK